MLKKIVYLTAIISIASLQTMYSAYTTNERMQSPIAGKDGTRIYPSGVNAVPREISAGKGPIQPMSNAGAGRIDAIKQAIETLNNQTGSNLKLNCFSGTRYGPVGPNEVAIAKFRNPSYQQGMMGSGEYCYLVAVPVK